MGVLTKLFFLISLLSVFGRVFNDSRLIAIGSPKRTYENDGQYGGKHPQIVNVRRNPLLLL